MSLVIERKLPGETVYSTITTLQNGNAWGQHDLSYDDNIVTADMGAIKYRVKMVIATDTSFYLDSMSVINNEVCNSVATENNIIISQGVNSEDVGITISRITAAKITILIQNALGQRVYKNEFQQAPVISELKTLHLNQVVNSRGIYFITVYVDNKKVKTKKILRP